MTKQLRNLIFFVLLIIILPICLGNFILMNSLTNKLIKEYKECSTQNYVWDYGRFSVRRIVNGELEWQWLTAGQVYRDTNEISFHRKIGYFNYFGKDSIIDWKEYVYKPGPNLDDKFDVLDIFDYLGHEGWELVHYYENTNGGDMLIIGIFKYKIKSINEHDKFEIWFQHFITDSDSSIEGDTITVDDSAFWKSMDSLVEYNKTQPGYDSTDPLGLFK